MGKLFELAGSIIYLILSFVLFPLFIIVEIFIGILIFLRFMAKVHIRASLLGQKFRTYLSSLVLKKRIRAITQSLHFLLVKR